MSGVSKQKFPWAIEKIKLRQHKIFINYLFNIKFNYLFNIKFYYLFNIKLNYLFNIKFNYLNKFKFFCNVQDNV